MTFKVRVADNGYIVESDGFIDVYEDREKGDNMPREMLEDLLSDLINPIIHGEATEFVVKVEVKGIK